MITLDYLLRQIIIIANTAASCLAHLMYVVLSEAKSGDSDTYKPLMDVRCSNIDSIIILFYLFCNGVRAEQLPVVNTRT